MPSLLYNIDYEEASIVYMIVINVYLHARYSGQSPVNREFRHLALYVLITNVLDVVTAVTISCGASFPRLLNILLNTAYYGSIVVVGFQYIRYVMSYVSPEKTSLSLKVNRVVYIACLICVLANVFTGHIFYFDDQGQYMHGALYMLVYVIPYYCMIYSTGIMIFNYKLYTRRLRLSIACFLLVALAGPTLQVLFFPNVLLSVFSIALGIILIMFTLETPDYPQLIKTMNELDELQRNLQKEVKQQTEKADKLTRQALKTLAETIDAKDKYTNGHSTRVATYAREIARRYGLSEKEQQDIYYIGLLHDIGKIGIPDSIINKPSSLTDEEYAVIKTHPSIGADILKSIATEIPGLDAGARWHHERYDGCGYPDRLKGEQIPMEARIIGVADAYDAMTSDRSYRRVLPQSAVREEFERKKGIQFDAAFADIMIQMIDEDTDYRMREFAPPNQRGA